MTMIVLALLTTPLLIWLNRTKKYAQFLFGLVAFGGCAMFFMGVVDFEQFGGNNWPGAVLAGIGLAGLLGTAVAVKLLYFRSDK